MPEIEISSGHQAIITSCFQFRFEWMSDRWKQEVVSLGSCASIPRIWSLEGVHSPDDPTRVSGPIYQQIDVQHESDGVVRALLVGQSGPHHFSAAVSVEEKPDGAVVDIDVADRCRSPVEALAATYLIESSDAELRHSEGSAALAWHHPESRLIFEADQPTRISAQEGSLGTIRVQALATIDASEQTHRFRYRWRWVHSPEHRIWDHTA